MSAIAKLADQIAIARAAGHFVVLTPDEAQAVVDESLNPHGQRVDRSAISQAAPAPGGCPVCGDDACPGNHPAGSVVTRASAPPHEGDDEFV